jgi:hypothetical protein
MKIVYPNNTTHKIKLIPRFTPVGVCEFIIEGYTQVIDYQFLDGVFTFYFTFTFKNKDRFSFYIINQGEILYRGKIYATASETQNYKQTDEVYEY